MADETLYSFRISYILLFYLILFNIYLPVQKIVIHRFNRFWILFPLLLLFILIASCDFKKEEAIDEMPRLYPPPLNARLNTEGGYSVNQVNGDSIFPLLNSLGDTLVTGKPLPAHGKELSPEITARAKVSPISRPANIPIAPQYSNYAATKVIPVNKDTLTRISTTSNAIPFLYINSMGDTLLTGVPVPIKGRIVPCNHPMPVPALPPQTKVDAHLDL